MVLDFGLISSNLFPSSDVSGDGMGAIANTVIWNDVGIGIVPIGSVVAWLKNITGIPPLLPSFVQCDGQTLSDGDSPLNGQVIPDLNGSSDATRRFLRGNDTAGGSGGSDTHTHTVVNSMGADTFGPDNAVAAQTTSSASSFPPYWDVVWIIRVK